MNTTTRILTRWDTFVQVEATPTQEILAILLAVGLVLMTALSLIYVKDLNRQLYSEFETLRQNQEELKIQKDQLLLEQNTFAAQARVQEMARDRLNMVSPDPSSIVTLKVNGLK